jgi:hypothetical protein
VSAVSTLVSVLLGIGLSAACGFRVFVPFLIVGIAARTGHVTLGGSFAWMASTPALIVLAVATVIEVAAYYVPWLDHALDVLATPAAVVAGVLMTASVVTGLDPMTKWTLALIAGGGIAGTVQALTVGTRKVSLLTTGGLGNPIVATAELGGSIGMALLAIALPLLAFAVIAWALFFGIKFIVRRSRGSGSAPA